MSLWNPTVTEQAGITTTLLDPAGFRPRLLAEPMLAGMLPGLDHVHAKLTVVAPARAAEAAERELVTLTEEGNALDGDHDRTVRGGYRIFEGLAEVAPDGESAERYRALSLRVFPLGLATVQQSWMGEAGNAGRLRAELEGDPDLCDALDAIPLPGKRTMLTLVRGLVATGVRLGAIEARRASLRQSIAAAVEAAASEGAKDAASIGAVRKEWVDMVEALRAVLRMPHSPVDAALRDDVLIDDVERKADARARTRAAARKPEAPADPVVARPSKPPPANGAPKSVPPPAARPS